MQILLKKQNLYILVFLVFSLFSGIVFTATPVNAVSQNGAGHGETEVHNDWKNIDTWKVLNFIILIGAGFFLARKPAKEFFSSRVKNIEQEIKDLELKKSEVENQLIEYKEKFKNLDKESKKIIADYIKLGEEARARIIAEAEEQASKFEKMAKHNIEQEIKSARVRLQHEVVEKTMIKVEEVIVDSVSSEDQKKLIDQYLKKVVA